MARKPKRDLTVEEQLARGPLDLPFLMLTMLLLGVGLIMMFSASFATAYYNDGDPLVYIKNQAVYAAAGVVVMFLVSKINYQTFRLLSVPGIVAAILLLVLALSPLGVELNEVKRWVRIGPIQFQPSEVAKVAVILFFAFSFTFSISHEEAVSAFEQNISALALAAQVIPGHIIHITSTVLNIFAVLTAFFGIYLGFHEAIKGIILNLLSRIIDTKKINSRMLTLAICAFIVITLTIWVSFRVSVLVFFQLGSPLYGIVSCLIPFFLIYKVAQLEKLRGFKAWLILLYGILLCLSPLLKLIE